MVVSLTKPSICFLKYFIVWIYRYIINMKH
jgi:hypothetical protein